MVEQKTGPQLVLEHNLLYQVVGDRLFWEMNPAFLDLKDDGEAAHERVVQAVLGGKPLADCAGCSTIKGAMRSFLTEFSRRLAYADSEAQEQFVEYVTKKRGYRPQPIVVYHKDDGGRTHELRL
jgi:hypothetical protein